MNALINTATRAPRPTRLALALAAAFSLGALAAPVCVPAAVPEPFAARSRFPDIGQWTIDGRLRMPSATQAPASVEPGRPAATIVVTNCNDIGAGSLRAAVNASVSGDTIDLTELACSTITLTSGAIFFLGDVTFQGPGAGALTISGGNASSIFLHLGYGTVEFADLSIADALEQTEYNASGACVFSTGSVFLYHASVSGCVGITYGNDRVNGAAVSAKGNVIMIASTVSHSSAYALGTSNAYGGGVYAKGDFFSKYSTISDNLASAANGGGFGGGLWVLGSADIAYSTISSNVAQTTGGAVLINRYRTTPLVVRDSTISNNYAFASTTGAGLFSKAPITISNSTITGNVERTAGAKYGAGLCLYGPVNADLHNTIISGNFLNDGAALQQDDIAGGPSSTLTGSHNVLGLSFLTLPADTLTSNPQLAPLADNGGPTRTHALLAGSPAIDAGDNGSADAFDQRGPGFPRPQGSATDIGAFEFQPFVAVAPTVAKSFSPALIPVDGISTLTITLGNANATPATLTAGLYDILPASVLVAGSPNASTDCVGGSVSADGDVVSLGAAAQIPAAGSCSVSVDVTAGSAGVFTNTIAAGDPQTDAGGNAEPAMADLTVAVAPIAPTLGKSFAPSSIVIDGTSTLTITLDNANAGDAILTAALTDALPTPLLVSSLGDATTTCAGGIVEAAVGANTVVLDAGAQVPAGGSCSVTVSISGASAGSFTNLLDAGALQTDAGSNPDPAAATLTVTATAGDLIFEDGFDGS